MEITSSNDGLLTNIEVFDLLASRREQRKESNPIAIDLQNRERIEMQVLLSLIFIRMFFNVACFVANHNTMHP